MTRKKTLKRRVSLKLELSLYKEIERLAKEEDRSINNQIRQLLKRGLKD